MKKSLQIPPILSIDWLQLNVQQEIQSTGKFHGFFTVKNLPLGTRHFKLVQELYRNNKRVATVVSKPHSPLLDERMMLVKFDNWALYGTDLSAYVQEFLALNGMKFQNVSRIDICADFQEFYNMMNPGLFIKKYVRTTFLKMGKVGKFKTVGTQNATIHEWESLRFGSNLSEISYYLYNKRKEMNEVKWKPWIAERWLKAGFDPEKDTWRLEFSIKSGAKSMVNTETGESKLLATLDILKPEFLNTSYNILRHHYFRFVWNDGQKKKSRMRELKLFAGDFSKYTIVDCDGQHDSTRATKIFIKKLEEVNQELRGNNFDLAIAAADLKQQMIVSRGLQTWAMRNNLAN